MKKFKMIIGIPGSGKTSFSKIIRKDDDVLLSSDQIRIDMFGFEDQTHNQEVFERMKKETIKSLKAGFNVIYDATNINKKRRKDIIAQAKSLGAEVDAYMICCPINTLLDRNATRTERQIPWDKLWIMIKNIEPPMYYEGFNNIYLINGGDYHDFYDYEEIIIRCVNYNQDNPYHTETLEEHIMAVTKKSIEYSNIEKLNVVDKRILEMAAKYHDFGKLYTRQFNDKKEYFVYYGHERVSTYMFLCHLELNRIHDNLNRVRLCDSDYQIATLILNHMQWYQRENMTPIKELFNDNDLYHILVLLHKADNWGRNENAIIRKV